MDVFYVRVLKTAISKANVRRAKAICIAPPKNELNMREYSDGQTGELGGTADMLEAGFLDVNSDGLVTPLDALLVINDLKHTQGSERGA